jgi:hypothetical protein
MHLWLFALHALHYMSFSHICIFAVDPEELPEPAPVEEATPSKSKASPGAYNHCP